MPSDPPPKRRSCCPDAKEIAFAFGADAADKIFVRADRGAGHRDPDCHDNPDQDSAESFFRTGPMINPFATRLIQALAAFRMGKIKFEAPWRMSWLRNATDKDSGRIAQWHILRGTVWDRTVSARKAYAPDHNTPHPSASACSAAAPSRSKRSSASGAAMRVMPTDGKPVGNVSAQRPSMLAMRVFRSVSRFSVVK